jgi:hypothetical protein
MPQEQTPQEQTEAIQEALDNTRAAQEAFKNAMNDLSSAIPTSDLRKQWRLKNKAIQRALNTARAVQEAFDKAMEEKSEAIQKALDNARAAQEAFDKAMEGLENAMPNGPVPWSRDLRGVNLRGRGVKSIVHLAKVANDELDEFEKLGLTLTSLLPETRDASISKVFARSYSKRVRFGHRVRSRAAPRPPAGDGR